MGERLTRVDIISTSMMMLGGSITTVFGNHCDPGYNLAELEHKFTNPLVMIYTGLYLSLVLAAYLKGRASEREATGFKQVDGGGGGHSAVGVTQQVRRAAGSLKTVGAKLTPKIVRRMSMGIVPRADAANRRNRAACIMAFAAAGCGTMQNVMLKGLSELIGEAFNGDDRALLSVGFWVMVALVVVFAIAQVSATDSAVL